MMMMMVYAILVNIKLGLVQAAVVVTVDITHTIWSKDRLQHNNIYSFLTAFKGMLALNKRGEIITKAGQVLYM